MKRTIAVLVCAFSLVALLPTAAGAETTPGLSVSAAILYAPATGQVLYGVNPNRQVAIASTTKLMTALVTLEHARLNQLFADPDYHPAAADSQLGLVPGERMSVHDLMLAMLLPSADDAAEDLAYNVGHGSVGRFVGMMNAKARQLGLTGTHYSTPIGLDTPGNYSTAYDLVKLAAYDLKTEPFFARTVALPRAVLKDGEVILNRNDLVARYPWIHGVKTGHTLDAGYVLVAAARRNGLTLLSAVLGTASEDARDQNTLALLDYGYANFHLVTPVRAGHVMAHPAVKDQSGKVATVIAGRTFTRIVPRDTRVRTKLELPHELSGPLARHTVVGSVVVFEGRRELARIPLLLARAIPAVSPVTQAAHFVTRPSTLVSLLVLLVAVLVIAVRRRERARRRGRGAQPA